MRRTLYGNNSATVDADGGLWVAGGRHDDPTVGDIYKFEVGGECDADLDGSGTLDLFDFLAFVNFFNAENPIADSPNEWKRTHGSNAGPVPGVSRRISRATSITSRSTRSRSESELTPTSTTTDCSDCGNA